MSYYLKGMSEFPKLQPITIRIESVEYTGVEKMYFMLVMNGRSAGGFRRVAPDARMDDGLLDVLLFREMPITELPGLFFKVMQGNHSGNKNVIYFRTKELYLESDEDIGTDVDGEKGCKFPLRINCIPKKLQINTLVKDMEGSIW
jgi:diacylglycerol kinase family enzyme